MKAKIPRYASLLLLGAGLFICWMLLSGGDEPQSKSLKDEGVASRSSSVENLPVNAKASVESAESDSQLLALEQEVRRLQEVLERKNKRLERLVAPGALESAASRLKEDADAELASLTRSLKLSGKQQAILRAYLEGEVRFELSRKRLRDELASGGITRKEFDRSMDVVRAQDDEVLYSDFLEDLLDESQEARLKEVRDRRENNRLETTAYTKLSVISRMVGLTEAQKDVVFGIYATGRYQLTRKEKEAVAKASRFPADSEERRAEIRTARTEKELRLLGTVLTESQLADYKILSR